MEKTLPEPPQKKMRRRKTFIIICSLFVSGIALFLLQPFTAGDNAGASFRWVPANPGDRFVDITTGETVVVPFEFKVGADLKEISFGIEEESLQGKGIFIKGALAQVRNSTASSQVIFNLRPGEGLRAGHYRLTIIARDAATGDIVQEGKIPFGVDIRELLWRCSC
jgi:hypothetical protein